MTAHKLLLKGSNFGVVVFNCFINFTECVLVKYSDKFSLPRSKSKLISSSIGVDMETSEHLVIVLLKVAYTQTNMPENVSN